MKKLLILILVVFAIYFTWQNEPSNEEALEQNIPEQGESVPGEAEIEGVEEESDSFIDAALRKLSILGTWEAETMETNGEASQSAENTLAFRFDADGGGECVMGEDVVDIIWEEQDGIVGVVFLSGINLPTSLNYVDDRLQWEVDGSIINFIKQ